MSSPGFMGWTQGGVGPRPVRSWVKRKKMDPYPDPFTYQRINKDPTQFLSDQILDNQPIENPFTSLNRN